MIALIVSCSKEAMDDNGIMLKEATIDMQSLPVSAGGITPVILKVDQPKGGNVTCNDVAEAYITSFDLCGDKLDYNGSEFNGEFPLDVTVEGVFVSFSTDGGNCIQIGDKYYKVGAVIVKGGNKANVYYYPTGTLGDSGLASPINSSGSPAGLSNLTFCFVECELKEPVLILVKALYFNSFIDGVGTGSDWAVSTGSNVVYTTGDWCDYFGRNFYPETSSFALSGNVGSVNIAEGFPEGVHSLIITVDLNDGLVLDHTYIYVGSLAGLGNLSTCPSYWWWPYQDQTKVNTHVITIPY